MNAGMARESLCMTPDLTYNVFTEDGLRGAIADTEACFVEALRGDVTIAIAADEDEDNCLTAAANLVATVLKLDGWDLRPCWEPDGSREYVWLVVPARALHDARGVNGEVQS